MMSASAVMASPNCPAPSRSSARLTAERTWSTVGRALTAEQGGLIERCLCLARAPELPLKMRPLLQRPHQVDADRILSRVGEAVDVIGVRIDRLFETICGLQ